MDGMFSKNKLEHLRVAILTEVEFNPLTIHTEVRLVYTPGKVTRRFQPTQSRPVGVLWENGCSFSGRMSRAMVDVMDGLLPAFNKRGKTKPTYSTHIYLAEQNTALITECLLSPLIPGRISSLLVDTWVAREDRKQWEGKESFKVITEEDNRVLDLQLA